HTRCNFHAMFSGSHPHQESALSSQNFCVEAPCMNGGLCSEGEGSYFCHCKPGFKGKNCEAKNPCIPNPCTNMGACKRYGTKHVCACPNGFTGSRCQEQDQCFMHNPCKNAGKCRLSKGVMSCRCPKGFTGRHCEMKDLCAPNPCSNRGVCTLSAISFHCQCPLGFTGESCKENDNCEPNPCQNGGRCSNKATENLKSRSITRLKITKCVLQKVKEISLIVNARKVLLKYIGIFSIDYEREIDSPKGSKFSLLRTHLAATLRLMPESTATMEGVIWAPCVIFVAISGEVITVKETGAPGENPRLSIGFSNIYQHNMCYPDNPCENNGVCKSDGHNIVCKCHPGFLGDHCEEVNYCYKHVSVLRLNFGTLKKRCCEHSTARTRTIMAFVRRSYETNPEVNNYSEEGNSEQNNVNTGTGTTNSPDYSQVQQPTEEELQAGQGMGVPFSAG
ncbi:neurogenic locus notch homolog 1-like, partial [Paramuricea clavata]